MKKLIVITSILLTAFALHAQQSPESILESFFADIAAAKYLDAIENLPLSNKLENDTSQIAKVLKKLKMTSQTAGTYCGYERISMEEVSPSFVYYSYFIKYSDVPVRVQLTFYKPKEKWQVNKINIANSSAASRSRANTNRQRLTR